MSTGGWDRIAWSNGEVYLGITGIVHHSGPGGCQGRKDSARGHGWHVRPGTPQELAASPAHCATCTRRVATVDQGA